MPTASSQTDLAWVYADENPEWQKAIVDEFNIHPISAQVLVARGFKTLESIHQFLYAQLPALHDPATFAGMPEVVARVLKALENKEPILIYGDNDVDGISGTTLLTEFFQLLDNPVYFALASRHISRSELIVESLEFAKEHDCKLLITVDCGITASAEIARIRDAGVDVIITDHHEVTDELPDCEGILNPKLPGNTYPNRDITGVGVAFKLAHGVTNALVASGKIDAKKVDLKTLLDLVTLGTVSDMGALHGENRIFVRYGLRQIQLRERIGLAKLADICDVDCSEVTTIDIASKIAPRLNSLGRIDDPRKGVKLLLLKDKERAEEMAIELDLNNIERQKIERTTSSDVERIFDEDAEILKNKAIIMASDQWHPGVIAIVATRISKQFHRPTVIIAIENGIGKGSIRSISEFSLLDALKKSSDLLLNFGGHDVAAGIAIPTENIEEFKKRFIALANEKLQDEDVVPKLYIDSKADFEDLTFEFMEAMSLLQPHGNENPPPVLYAETTQAWPPKVIGKTHLKLYLEQGDRVLEGIGFGMANRIRGLRRRGLTLRVAFTPHINTFQNKASIQLLIRDFQIVE